MRCAVPRRQSAIPAVAQDPTRAAPRRPARFRSPARAGRHLETAWARPLRGLCLCFVPLGCDSRSSTARIRAPRGANSKGRGAARQRLNRRPDLEVHAAVVGHVLLVPPQQLHLAPRRVGTRRDKDVSQDVTEKGPRALPTPVSPADFSPLAFPSPFCDAARAQPSGGATSKMSVELPADITRRVTIAAAGPLNLNRENCAVREQVSSQHDPSEKSIPTWYFIAGALRAVSIVAADGEDRLLAFLHRRHACRHQIRSVSVPTLHFNLYGVRTKECFLCEYLAMVGPICSLDSSVFFIVQVTRTVQSKLTRCVLLQQRQEQEIVYDIMGNINEQIHRCRIRVPISHPLMTLPSPSLKENGDWRSTDESNFEPSFSNVPV